jgi:hypothetical protein
MRKPAEQAFRRAIIEGGGCQDRAAVDPRVAQAMRAAERPGEIR